MLLQAGDGMSAPLGEEKIEILKTMHAAGAARNEIARELGCSPATVSKWAARYRLSFDRLGTQAATAAKVADAKARRAQLQLDLLARADELLKRFDQPAMAFAFGGRDNSFNSREIDEPTFADKHKIVMAVSTAVAASIRIDEHDRATENPSELDAWIEAMKGPGE